MQLSKKKHLSNSKKIHLVKGLLLITVLVAFFLFSRLLVWNESRLEGIRLCDFILANIGPYELHYPIFILTYGMVAFGLFFSLKETKTYINTMLGIIFFIIFRSITLTLFPLLPPDEIIPLKDVILTNTFYCKKVLERDLFFSGHTAALFLLAFINVVNWVKKTLIIGGILLGLGLILQHVHYTIDVIAAPLFAWFAYYVSKRINEKIISKYFYNL